MPTLEALREKALADATIRLSYTVIPNLETVIMGTPTGPLRDKLTEANILLKQVVEDSIAQKENGGWIAPSES